MLDRIYKAHNLMDAACKDAPRQVNIMEVCGTHTVSIFRNGIRPTLPPKMKLLSGPGCPVCVTDQSYIDDVLTLADRDDVMIATYGDMIRVPGKSGSLETRADRRNVKVVLSSMDALELARNNPSKTVVFVGVGFETTAPATAAAIKQAASEKLDNFTVLCGHKLAVPAMKALLSDPSCMVDGFLCPGHVSVIIGSDAFLPIANEFKKPCIVAGFEPMQIIEGIAEICRQIALKTAEVKSIYHAVVKPQGNPVAKALMDEVFEVTDGPWRGLGIIPQGSHKIRSQYKAYDAHSRFGLDAANCSPTGACQCGKILSGHIDPPQCPMFESSCTPDSPVGPCMVSSEGACAAWYKYGRRRKRNSV